MCCAIALLRAAAPRSTLQDHPKASGIATVQTLIAATPRSTFQESLNATRRATANQNRKQMCDEEELLFQEAVLPEIPEKLEKRSTAVCLIANKRFARNICLCVIVDVFAWRP